MNETMINTTIDTEALANVANNMSTTATPEVNVDVPVTEFDPVVPDMGTDIQVPENQIGGKEIAVLAFLTVAAGCIAYTGFDLTKKAVQFFKAKKAAKAAAKTAYENEVAADVESDETVEEAQD